METTITLSYKEFETLKKYKDDFEKLNKELRDHYEKVINKKISLIFSETRNYSDWSRTFWEIKTDDEATLILVKKIKELEAELKSFQEVSTWRNEKRYKKLNKE
jgi:hypothetical protein